MYVLVLALLPRMALPCRDTRDAVEFVVARERTERAVLFAATRDAVVPRDTTLRDAVPRDAVVADVPRDAVAVGRLDVVVARVADAVVVRAAVGVVAVRAVVARDVTPRDIVAELAPFDVPRTTTLDVVFAVEREDAGRADARTFPELRADETDGVADAVVTGAIGSANTARMDKNVEQTKNAPASKKTVPIAFFIYSAKLRLFINYSPVFRKRPENPMFNDAMVHTLHVHFY